MAEKRTKEAEGQAQPAVSLDELYEVILQRVARNPQDSYVAQLIRGGEDVLLKKLGEECAELMLAAKNGKRGPMVHELADLWFHILVWMASAGIQPHEVREELGSRFGRSGLQEKQSRRQS